ncbi:hypothetical protein GX48_00443 [Paracoccidioides brasiliensis]|nr:hypothetical protein GX48_00443 [Paracoccidioides brasiliensis]
MDSRPIPPESGNKRARSPSGDHQHTTASKVPKTQSNHLQINYLARQYPQNIPLVSPDDTLPSILRLMNDYDGVLQRHESIAGNLGACPLGPILVTRFERLFDGPPKVLKSHGKEGTTVSWLDVVEFAKNKPEQFTLEKTRNGVPVCQIYTKQSRVEISEEDYILIKSGIPQKIIPPQPIVEDEEKELGALEILEKNLSQIINLADQVSARARQLNHRFKNRKTAIVTRRENDLSLSAQQQRSISPFRESNGNVMGTNTHTSNGHSHPHSPPGFVAVNSRYDPPQDDPSVLSAAQFMFPHSSTDNITIINGTSIKGASPATRAELMKKFFTTADRHARGFSDEEEETTKTTECPPPARQTSRSRPRASDPGEYSSSGYAGAPVPIPSTPSSLLPQPKSSNHYERDDGGPYKIEMVSRMEGLQRGERILPPCDRCRRLQMDCHKNLTACMGCTKKHAKCSWKDVKLEELRNTYPRNSNRSVGSGGSAREGPMVTETDADRSLGGTGTPATTIPGVGIGPSITDSMSNNNSSASGRQRASEPQHAVKHSPPSHSMSDHTLPGLAEVTKEGASLPLAMSGSANIPVHEHVHSHSHSRVSPHSRADMDVETEGDGDGDDADSTDPLAQAIRDTVGKHNLAAERERERERERGRERERSR